MPRNPYITGAVIFAMLAVAAVAVPLRLSRARVLGDLHDASPAVRLAAIRSLDAKSDVDLLLPALKDEDADVRLVTAWRLAGEGPQEEKRVAALIDALRDRHAGVRQAAAESLWSLGPASGAALIAALQDSDPHVRAGAARALRSWQSKAERKRAPGEVEAITPRLKALLEDEDAEVRKNAKETLHRLR